MWNCNLKLKMRQYQLDVKTYFSASSSINPNCLQIIPLQPKKKLQKSININLKYIVVLADA
jgi:hypothetical protein